MIAPHHPTIRRVPHRPETPGRLPHLPDMGEGGDDPEIEERGDPTARKSPQHPSPEIRGDFIPDLGEKPVPEEDLKKKKKKKKDETAEVPPASKTPGKSIH